MSKTRCAIYTRKSTEEGLDQEFNSLDAQREACAAFIVSQAGQGWKEISTRYDDGGLSGGTMDRPALQDLLLDIKAGKIDVVVVYKIDRLTRSLMDFAKMVDVFDAHGVSFVSVTQQFNTLSSMGRLTLNVLLSFAQFEREVTAERIRDKIAASKRKGMWMGGVVPLGYKAMDKKLVIEPAQAETVRLIFSLYLEIGSVRRLKEQLDHLGHGTTQRWRSDGTSSGGRPFSRGHLYCILSNPVYAGLISHKGQITAGQHEAIVSREIWEAAQLSLNRKAPLERKAAVDRSSSAIDGYDTGGLLSGLLYDETGDRLSPSHANKKGVRYRYYISQRLMQARRKDISAWRLPAKALEDVVIRVLVELLADHRRLQDILGDACLQVHEIETVTVAAQALRDGLHDPAGHRTRSILSNMIQRITVEPGQLTLAIDRRKLATALGMNSIDADEGTEPYQRVLPFALRRRGVEAKLILREETIGPALLDNPLIETVSNAHAWLKLISAGACTSIAAIAESEATDDGEISRVLPLAFLAPDIVAAILSGRQPVTLTARYLKRLKPLQASWSAQRRILGFAPATPH